MALGFNYGSDKSGGWSSSRGGSFSKASGATDQYVWQPSMRANTQLYGDVTNLMGQQGGIGQAARGIANQYMPGMKQGYQGLQQMAAGGGPLAQYAQPNNALAAQQSQMMMEQVGQNFREQLLPGIRGQAGLVGGMGAGREGVAQGMAAGSAQREMAYGAADFYAQQYGIGAQAAAGQTDAMLAAAGQMPGYAEGAMNLGMMPYEAAWMPYQQAGGILGGPTVMSKVRSQSRATQRQKEDSAQWSKGMKIGGSL